MTNLEAYKAAQGPIPKRMLKWRLYGSGLENLHAEEADVPSYGPDELLVRQDACGLCFSDTKVIALGSEHPRMAGRDMRTSPVTLGHEVSVTVVGVGSNLTDRFHIGQRYLVQADVFYKGVSMAYGYAISGGLAEYSVIPHEMIDGDEGCYLLPIEPDAGYAEIALVEPWACVVSAYNQGHRPGLKDGGNLLILCSGPADLVALSGLADTGARPANATVLISGSSPDAGPGALAQVPPDVAEAVERNGLVAAMAASPRRIPTSTEEWASLRQDATGGTGFDDILVLSQVTPEAVEGAASTLANHGIMNLVGDWELPRKLSIDIGRIHYNWHHYVGTPSGSPADAYSEPRTADLLPGGAAWFIGAGGPMGQMHVQRAVFHPRPPALVVATDIDAERLDSVVDRFGGAAQARGVRLVAINPKDLGPAEFDAELRRLTDQRGFDDVVSLVPVPALIEHAAGHVADRGWFNVFAGVARGTMARLDLDDVRRRGVRFVGSSGSALSDMRETLAKVESCELSTNASLAAIGGMRAAREGMAAVKEARYPGKTLIFPLIPDLPLMSLGELERAYPTVHAKLKDGRFWTQDAEDELLRLTLGQEG